MKPKSQRLANPTRATGEGDMNVLVRVSITDLRALSKRFESFVSHVEDESALVSAAELYAHLEELAHAGSLVRQTVVTYKLPSDEV